VANRVPAAPRTLNRWLAVLLLGLVTFAMMVMWAVVDFRRGVPALLGCAAVLAWHGCRRRGSSRVIAFSGGALLLAGYVARLIAS
jgi:hypothetical protein